MNIEERVRQLVEEKIEDRPDLFLVDVKMYSNGQLSVLIDGDKGVDISDCVAISRYVGFVLEEENLIAEAYHLEVSSVGVGTPLSSLRQYHKNLNRIIKVKLIEQKQLEGRLVAVNDTGITLVEENKKKAQKAQTVESFVPFDQIIETRVLISFK